MANKALEQDLLRKRLRPAEYITIIEESMEEIRTNWRSLGKNQIDGLKAMADMATRMLGKSLPDLRAIEITPERESPVRFIFQTGDVKETVDSKSLKRKLDGDEEPKFIFQ